MKLINRPLLTMVSLTAFLAGCDTLSIKKSDHDSATEASSTAPKHSAQNPSTAPIEKTYATIWERIRAGYGLPETSNTAIDKQMHFYTGYKAYFSKMTQQSEPYLHYVVTEMEANKMPLELALLPFIESAYNPSAAAPGNAGMWQLGSATGRNFGLRQNSWYDGRKDVVASTDAAIRLLKKLYTTFDNDWLLAIAAYNAGEGTIQQAIAKNQRAGKPTDFWSLPLSQTTQGYVPQLMALAKIVAQPELYGYTLYPIADAPYFVKINVDTQINLAQAAQNTDIDVTQLKKLNSGFNGWLTDPTGSYQLLVPVADAAEFTLKLDALPKLPSVKWQEHLVKKGDTLEIIAKKYGVNLASIKTTNNLKSNSLSVGQRLQIPLTPLQNTAPEVDANLALQQNHNDAYKKDTDKNYYTVKSGENLWTIAKAQNTSVDALAQLNDMSPKSALKPGQKLLVLSQATNEETREPRKLNYTVKAGDTLGKIAAQYKVTSKQIMQWNNIKDETSLRPNQVLTLTIAP